jgi:hypothetical protein
LIRLAQNLLIRERGGVSAAHGASYKLKAGFNDAQFASGEGEARRPRRRRSGNAWPALPGLRQIVAARGLIEAVSPGRPRRNDSIKETRMSSIANVSSSAAAPAPVNIHPHGHRKGLRTGSTTDSSSGTAAQIPAGTGQNLFGSLLNSLEQVIGVQSLSTAAAPAAASTTGAAAGAATPAPAVSGAAASSAATSAGAAATAQFAGTKLQTYLNNMRNLRANGSQTPNLPGSKVSVSA